MIWNRKQKVSPAELADAMLNIVASAGSNAAKNLALNGPARGRFDDKARRYGIASVLMAVESAGQKNSRLTAVREEFERRIFPPVPTEATSMLS
jgi:hypothetical protein